MIKKGINIWSFSPTKIDNVFALAEDAGFDGVELSITENGEISLNSDEKELLSIKKRAADRGLVIPSLASDLAWGNPITSNEKKTRENGIKYFKKQIETAAVLGADTILMVPGYVGVDFIPDSEVVYYEDAFKRAQDGINEVLDTAKKCKVAIGIENVWNKFLTTPLEMKNFIDSFGSDYVGSYFDVGNVIYAGYSEQWIRVLGKRIKKIHFKDYRRAVGTLAGFVDLLAGDVNYPEVMKALSEIDYDSFTTAEMIPSYTHHPYQIIYNTSSSMDAILGRKKFLC